MSGVSDEQFVRTLISSGLSHGDLDAAFSKSSPARLNVLTKPILSSTPLPGSKEESVKKELRKICGGGSNVCNHQKFKRIMPIYRKLRGW